MKKMEKPMQVIDMRSDTITKPTARMLEAMAGAEVGDDVFGEDPTVNRLEEIAADIMGKEAALFVASGTMGNLVSQLSWCGRGDEMILGDQSHIFFYEQGGSAAVGGIHPRTVPNLPDGRIDLEAIRLAIRSDNVHFPQSRLIVLENTHNRCNGHPLDVVYLHAVAELAHKNGMRLHVDGARIFNAAAALDVKASELADPADSISFCLSKGLAAPAGSLVCGTRKFIDKARRARKVLGGGMRQAGILAAAGIVALTEMTDRLLEDHNNAKHLATGLAKIPGIAIATELIKTNIVFIDITHQGLSATELADRLNAEGIRILPADDKKLRAVTNYHISPDDIEYVLKAFLKIFDSL
jgi:threonine aldolase